MNRGILRALCVGAAFAVSTHGYDTFYTFNEPAFVLGQTSPWLNVAPSTGMPGFETSFMSSVAYEAQDASSFPGSFYNFSGQFISPDSDEPGSVTLTFNSPILQLALDFGLYIPSFFDTGGVNFEGDGFVGFVSSAPFPDTLFQGGTVLIDPGFAFSSVTISGMNSNESPQLLALDNLQITAQPVPEPSTWAAIIAVAGIGGWQAGRRFLSRRK